MGPSGRETDRTLTDVRLDEVELPNLKVVLTPPKGKATSVALGMTPVVVGTDPECDLIVDDARVSRKHCSLTLGERGVVLRDLGSKNGTFIDKIQIREVFLDPKVRVTLGSSRLLLEAPRGPIKVQLSRGVRFGAALGASVAMRALFANLGRAAETDETIVLFGESGTGKELLARGIHDASRRHEGPFVVFDCSAVPPNLVEAELFGFVKGAFTGAVSARPGLFEQAHRGTLFIDELGELLPELQPKLLRALEARQIRRVGATEWQSIDVRVVAATHRDLRARVAAGTFREDLYYRLAVVEATIPPLRERRDDIPLLVEHFLAAKDPPRTWADLPPNAAEMLSAHNWPGNVRELRNTVSRLVLFPSTDPMVQERSQAPGPSGLAPSLVAMPLREARDMVVERFERSYIAAKLAEHMGNVSRAAESMGVSRQFLHRLIERYGLK